MFLNINLVHTTKLLLANFGKSIKNKTNNISTQYYIMSVRKSQSTKSKKRKYKPKSRKSYKVKSKKFSIDKFIKDNKKALDEARMNLYNKGLMWDKKGKMKRRSKAEMVVAQPVTQVQQLPATINPVMDEDKKKINSALLGALAVVGAVGIGLALYLNQSASLDDIKDINADTGENSALLEIISNDNQSDTSGATIREMLDDAGVNVSKDIDDSQLNAVFSNDSLSDEAKLDFATKDDKPVISDYTDFKILNNLFGE